MIIVDLFLYCIAYAIVYFVVDLKRVLNAVVDNKTKCGAVFLLKRKCLIVLNSVKSAPHYHHSRLLSGVQFL